MKLPVLLYEIFEHIFLNKNILLISGFKSRWSDSLTRIICNYFEKILRISLFIFKQDLNKERNWRLCWFGLYAACIGFRFVYISHFETRTEYI